MLFRSDDLVKAGKQETLALRDLLKFEFIFSDRVGFRDELLAESDLFDPDWRERIATAELRKAMIAEAPFLIAPTVLPTFLEAYFVVADRLAALAPAAEIRDAAFIDSCMAVGRQYLLQRLSDGLERSVASGDTIDGFQIDVVHGIAEVEAIPDPVSPIRLPTGSSQRKGTPRVIRLAHVVFATPKLDGIRCLKLGGKALTRSFKPISNRFAREWIEANLPDGVDGELMLRGGTFSETTSAIGRRDGQPDFVFHIFDYVFEGRLDEPYRQRVADLAG